MMHFKPKQKFYFFHLPKKLKRKHRKTTTKSYQCQNHCYFWLAMTLSDLLSNSDRDTLVWLYARSGFRPVQQPTHSSLFSTCGMTDWLEMELNTEIKVCSSKNYVQRLLYTVSWCVTWFIKDLWAVKWDLICYLQLHCLGTRKLPTLKNTVANSTEILLQDEISWFACPSCSLKGEVVSHTFLSESVDT